MGGRIATARVAAGASVRQLAGKLGCAHGAVTHWELGKRSISARMLYRLGRLLGVSVRWLMGLDPEGGPGTYRPTCTFEPVPRGRPRKRRRSPKASSQPHAEGGCPPSPAPVVGAGSSIDAVTGG